jgi:hypothetical protein
MAMVWLESAPSRLVTTVEVEGVTCSRRLRKPPRRKPRPPPAGVDDDQVAGRNAVARLEDELAFERNVIDEGAVLAAEVLHGPIVALQFEGEVLAGKAGVFGKAQFGGARPAHGDALAGERHRLHLAVGTLNQEFAVHERSSECVES